MQLEKEREMLLSKINDNPRMLESLSYERLKQIDEYCDICINKYKDKIKRIQNVN